jgi:hypothetical protein
MSQHRAVMAAEKLGHQLEWDPPANFFSNMNRMTCTVCHRAVLWNGSTQYGSALEGPCVRPTEGDSAK